MLAAVQLDLVGTSLAQTAILSMTRPADLPDTAQVILAQVIGDPTGFRRLRLVALAWLGRGTYTKDEWREAIDTARSEHSRRTAEYLLGLPLLGDYLEDGLALFDEGIVDDSDTREGLDSENEPLDGMKDKPQRQ